MAVVETRSRSGTVTVEVSLHSRQRSSDNLFDAAGKKLRERGKEKKKHISEEKQDR